jgi:hypothetical protein
MPKIDEVWEAKIKFWPEDTERHMLIKIYYVWADGRIQFTPALCYDGGPIWAESCAKFELIGKVKPKFLSRRGEQR